MKVTKIQRLRLENPWRVQVFFHGEWADTILCPTQKAAEASIKRERERSWRDYRIVQVDGENNIV